MPNTTRLTPSRSTLFATAAAALALLPRLGARPLTDWDEAIYAEVAREMLHFGALVPHWNDQLWLEKPPLAMWLTAAIFHLFGVTDFAARAVSAFSGITTVALLHDTLARTRGMLAAWLSTAILLGTFGFLHACHTGELDTQLAFTCTLAILGLARVATAPRSGSILFFTGFALAAMTKGAAAVTLPLTAVICAIAPPRLRLTRHIWLGLALFLAIVLPWHIAMVHTFGSAFLNEYLGLHVLARSTHQIEGHVTPWWFYLKVLVVAAPPFCLLYPAAIRDALKPRNKSESNQLDPRPFAIFALVTLLFFTVVQTRLPQYIVPIYPSLALLTAAYLTDRRAALLPAHPSPALWTKLATATAVIAAVSIALTAPARSRLHSAAASPAATALDSRDAIALLRNPPANLPSTEGPLLLWRHARIASIASTLFYAQRPVQQVQLLAPGQIPPMQPRDRYTFNPIPLDRAAVPTLRLILLDRTLVPQLPSGFLYTPLTDHGAMQLGLLRLNPQTQP